MRYFLTPNEDVSSAKWVFSRCDGFALLYRKLVYPGEDAEVAQPVCGERPKDGPALQ